MDNPNQSNVKVIAGFLASALEIEDSMSVEVYGAFLNKEKWPAHLNDKAFENIKELLAVLIQETEGHKKAFLNLQNKITADAPK